MKKFLSVTLILIVLISAFVIYSYANNDASYYSPGGNCLVNAKMMNDGKVPTYKEIATDSGNVGLLVGLPTDAVVGDSYFLPKNTNNTVKYFNSKGTDITNLPDTHIGTDDKIVVYSGSQILAEYSLVTYGDADGNGYFNVLDVRCAELCLNGHLDSSTAPAIYESVKPRPGVDNASMVVEDYQKVVNDALKQDTINNIKGRKYPIDETLSFESVIYENDGTAKKATLSSTDSNYMNCVSEILYNGVSEAPSASGIYAVTAVISDSVDYIVTPGERTLGFIVIAPNSNATEGYTTVVDNANKTITVNVNNAYAYFTAFNSELTKWHEGKYALNVNNTSVSTYEAVLSALAPREYIKYTDQTGNLVSTPLTNILGSYLTDDAALYADYNAKRTLPVNATADDKNIAFSLIFKQDEATVRSKMRDYELSVSKDGRGQRNTATRDIEAYGLRKDGERVVSGVVRKGSAIMGSSIPSSGLKTMMVGKADALYFRATRTKGDYSNSTRTFLFDTTNNNLRYSNTNTSDGTILRLCTSFLKELGMSMPVFASSITGKTGWATYDCSNEKTGLRYSIDYKFEFLDGTKTSETKLSLKLDSSITNGTVSVTPEAASNYNVYESMVQNEMFYLTPKPNSGYKLGTLKVVDANGNEIKPDADGLYIMPATSVTIYATFVAK